MRYKGVLFDMDGVLLENNAFHRQAWREAARVLMNLELSEVDLDTKVDGGRNPEIMARLSGRVPTEEEARELHEFKEGRYRDLARGTLREVLGLSRYLDFLEEQGIPYALVTSADDVNVRFGLEELGLSQRFDLRVLGSDVRQGKPHPEPYLRGAELLGLRPADCLAHEDALSGVRSAASAGCAVCALTTTQTADALLAAGARWAVPHFAAWLELLQAQEA
ncbi:HAD superfamily hydrolase (TIGR01509 family) [Deinobacterium chartae]|uniref:HAD superfamily hydrolase (TIGR01509 family) n=1 Tax=Deinobacterium chartae TaxID=521158 RepID=A0A841I2M6_9DEIO|nr:HAD-IA family hydrolase [Deinobacterium chartae]MBB6099937.1 HAD superfamily hydrolase (TIGR01509 family) [Deinobacterium chartae]